MSGLFGGFGASTQPQQSNSLFGSSTANANAKSSIFPTLGTAAPQSQTQTAGLFGNLSQPQQQQSSGLFGSIATSRPQQQSSGLFGNLGQSQQPQPQQQQTGGGLFGNLSQPQQQTGGGLFGNLSQPQQQTSSLFGNPTQQPAQQQTNSLFGAAAQPQQQQTGGLFGSTNNGIMGSSIMGGGQQQQQHQQQQQQQQQNQSSRFGVSGAPPLWQPGSGIDPRQKTVPDQIMTINAKWNPSSPDCVFEHYFYNQVGENRAPYYRPSDGEDAQKWEAALSKKPGSGYIPARAGSFKDLSTRLNLQAEHLMAFNARMHEINDRLTALLQKHDLVISIRTMEARRRHQILSQRCLSLATKIQVLKNRGYAMGGDEEEFKKRLVDLERRVLDPALEGRTEGIWARMVGVRERARALQGGMERTSKGGREGKAEVVDEGVLKKAAKILEDYASQLDHLRKEMDQIQAEFVQWESSKSNGNGVGRRR